MSGRIGHLAGNTECYLCQPKPRGLFGRLDLWAHSGVPCNAQLARMIGRVLTVIPTDVLWGVNLCLPGWEKHIAKSLQHDRDISGLYAKTPPHLYFTEREHEIGRFALERMGIKAPWVCLIVRDGAYLSHPAFSYHRYRDSDIDSYAKAARALAERGYTVVRMGAKVEKPFKIQYHPRIVDYAMQSRSDFMDIYLAAHCEFAISSGTGLDAVCTAFRRPVCFVNYVPLEYLNTWVEGLAIWKRHFRDGKEMTPAEIYESAGKFQRAEQFEEAGIELRDNTPEEIEEVALEMLAMQGTHMRFHSSESLGDYDGVQRRFWQAFPSGTVDNLTGKPLHGPIRLRIGHKFLESQ